MILSIEVPDEIMPEFNQQLYGDQYHAGFNNETLVVELLKEIFNMELEQLGVE